MEKDVVEKDVMKEGCGGGGMWWRRDVVEERCGGEGCGGGGCGEGGMW